MVGEIVNIEPLEEEFQRYAIGVLRFLFKYVLWLPLLLIIPLVIDIFVDSNQTNTRLLLVNTILLAITAIFILILLFVFFMPYFIRFFKLRSLSKETFILILKEENDPTKRGYKRKRVLSLIVYICTVICVITYVTFSITLKFI